MKINLGGITNRGEEDKQIKSMRRPHSYDKEISRPEDHFHVQTERKKKSLSVHKKEVSRQKRKANSLNSTGLKLDGLQMLPSNLKKL